MVEYIPWSPANEVETIQGMTVGLMPIDDTLWSRGKCSYKMLLYMSCGIPVVVSPYGMNAEVLAKGSVGCAAASQSDWADTLLLLLGNREMGAEMGREGRRVVEASYSLRTLASRMAAYLLGFRR
jgi:glycosyltransferase involved in cell wall biosynthesis